MIRIFVFRDLDKIMEIWLAGNISAHPFVNKEYWIQNFDMVKSVLPNAEAYVYEEGDIVGRRVVSRSSVTVHGVNGTLLMNYPVGLGITGLFLVRMLYFWYKDGN